MKAKQLEAITRHGQSLLAAFPNATERDPVKLCKKLRRIETSADNIGLRMCNGPFFDNMEAWADKETEKHLAKVRGLLGINEEESALVGLFVNRDPRGYALKLSDEWTRTYHATWSTRPRIYTDWGGYGILAPEIGEEGI